MHDELDIKRKSTNFIEYAVSLLDMKSPFMFMYVYNNKKFMLVQILLKNLNINFIFTAFNASIFC